MLFLITKVGQSFNFCTPNTVFLLPLFLVPRTSPMLFVLAKGRQKAEKPSKRNSNKKAVFWVQKAETKACAEARVKKSGTKLLFLITKAFVPIILSLFCPIL